MKCGITAGLLIFSMSMVIGCKSAARSEGISVEVTRQAGQGMPGDTADIHIAFFSVAYGIDGETYQGVEGILKPLESQGAIHVERRAWGREGEIDLCVFRQSANEMLMQELLTQLREAVQAGKNLRLTQSTVCRSKN